MSGSQNTEAGTDQRSTLSRLVMITVALSVVGFLASAIGHLAGWNGFDSGGKSTTAGSLAWLLYFFGGIAALVLGVVALIRGRSSSRAAEGRVGRIAVGYVIASIAAVALIDAVS